MRVYSSAVGIRGDMLYCPLPLSIDSYWTCEPDCVHCFSRRLNRTWGQDFRAADVEAVKKRLRSAKGKSPLHRAISQRKTLRVGNRSDPFQDWEMEHRISTRIVEFLKAEKWDTVIQTKFPQRAWDMTGLGEDITLMAVIMPGLEKDWEVLERRKTENPLDRIDTLSRAQKAGFKIGVNGEPFIPGYHTVDQFRETLKILKERGIKRYNTYNLHANDYVIKNFHAIGLDIERIWRMNHDSYWGRIQRQLLDIADQYDIILGCPDFVNTGWGHRQQCNTCCGIDVKNPCTYNTHYFKLAIQDGKDPSDMWDGVGDYEEGQRIIEGSTEEMYTMKDVVGDIHDTP